MLRQPSSYGLRARTSPVFTEWFLTIAEHFPGVAISNPLPTYAVLAVDVPFLVDPPTRPSLQMNKSSISHASEYLLCCHRGALDVDLATLSNPFVVLRPPPDVGSVSDTTTILDALSCLC